MVRKETGTLVSHVEERRGGTRALVRQGESLAQATRRNGHVPAKSVAEISDLERARLTRPE